MHDKTCMLFKDSDVNQFPTLAFGLLYFEILTFVGMNVTVKKLNQKQPSFFCQNYSK